MAKVIIEGLTFEQGKAIASYLQRVHYELNEHLWHEEVPYIEVLSVSESESEQSLLVLCKPLEDI